MIIQPQKEIITPISLRLGIRGFMRLRLINKFSGKIRVDTGWFPNLILNSGRNEMGTRASWLTHAHVGTNNTAPLVSHTGLLGKVAHTATISVAAQSGAQGTAPYYGWKRITYRFDVGAGQGGQNLSEAGVGWGTGVSNLISRALIVDAITGSPTTITPLADEILDLTYELRYYPPLTPVNQTVTLNSLVYDTVTKAAEVTSGGAWGSNIGTMMGEDCVSVNDWRVYAGPLGNIDTLPSGLTANLVSTSEVFNKAYSNNSYIKSMQASIPPSSWNVTGGIRSISIRTSGGSYQTSFTRQGGGGETVPKTNLFTMIMVWNISWQQGAPVFSGTIPVQNWNVGVPVNLVTSTYFDNKPAPLTFSVFAGSLPTGVTINSSTGLISGTPTLVESGNCTVELSNEVGGAISNSFNWTVT